MVQDFDLSFVPVDSLGFSIQNEQFEPEIDKADGVIFLYWKYHIGKKVKKNLDVTQVNS